MTGDAQGAAAENSAHTAYLATLRALDANENDVQPLLDFARS